MGSEMCIRDSSGEGDSYGSSGRPSVWVKDIETAAEELKDISGARELIIVGLRMGGTLALNASFGRTVVHIVLWDPIVSGQGYLETCKGMHNEMLKDSNRFSNPRLGHDDELLGFALSKELSEEISSLDLLSGTLSNVKEVSVFNSGSEPSRIALTEHLAAQGIQAKLHTIDDSPQWGALAELENLIAVGEASQKIVRHIAEGSG